MHTSAPPKSKPWWEANDWKLSYDGLLANCCLTSRLKCKLWWCSHDLKLSYAGLSTHHGVNIHWKCKLSAHLSSNCSSHENRPWTLQGAPKSAGQAKILKRNRLTKHRQKPYPDDHQRSFLSPAMPNATQVRAGPRLWFTAVTKSGALLCYFPMWA